MFCSVHAFSQAVDFRKESIYFIVTTRFFDGDPANNRPNEWCSYDPSNPNRLITDPNDVTWRGDFKGLIQKLDYIKDLGFTAIWITPIVQNRGPLDYHGYHAWDFTKIDPRLESPGATFQDLINAIHAKGMKIILDIVTNHSGRYGIKGVAEIKYNTDPTKSWYAADNPNWQYDGLTPNPLDGKIWSRANLAKMPAPYNSNLANYNWPGTENFVNTTDANWFHHSGNGFAQGWDDTTNLYQRALAGDCPDLNTESPAVRNYLVNAYKTFILMGVDALRWDTIKHMNRETVQYFIDQFKAIKPNIFIFGEVAQKRHELHTVQEINPHWYTWKGQVGNSANSGLAVLDFYAEASFHNPIEMGGNFSQVKDAARYDNLYSDPSTNVMWLDNHDFGPNNDWNRRFGGSAENLAACLNFMFTWRGIPSLYYGTEIQFMKGAYTDIHESADIEKSLDLTGRAYYGNAIATASTNKIYKHIKKLNAIRSAIPALQNGSWYWAGTSDGNGVGYVRESGSSYAVVGLAKDGNVNFTFTGLKYNGIYKDAVSGKVVTVSGGSLSFQAEPSSAGIYVYNGPGLIGELGAGFFQTNGGGVSPSTVTFNPTNPSAGQTLTVTYDGFLKTGTAVNLYWGIDNWKTPVSVPMTKQADGKWKTIITIPSSTLSVFDCVFNNGNNTWDNNNSQDWHVTVTPGTVASLKVHYWKADNWSNEVNIHYWNSIPAGATTWPGVAMTKDADGWYSFTFPNISSSSLLFVDKNNTTNKTPDLTRSTEGWYKDGAWFNSKPNSNSAPVVSITPAAGSYTNQVTVFINATDADNDPVTVYYTTDGTTPTTASPVYSSEFVLTASRTVKAFAKDNAGASSSVISNSYTIVPPSSGLTIHYYNANSWQTIAMHYWNVTPAGIAATTWPGVQMVPEGSGWFKYTIPNAASSNIIFSNNGAGQTADLTRTGDGWYKNGVWTSSQPVEAGLKVHFSKPTAWSNNIKIHYWNVVPTQTGTTWPGISTIYEGNGWFYYLIPNATSSNLLFSDNGSTTNKTADLTRTGEGWYNGVWSSTKPAGSPKISVNPENEEHSRIESFALYQNFPNPFNPSTNISFYLKETGVVRLAVYNALGQEIAVLVNGVRLSGYNNVNFIGTNLTSGIYFYKLETKDGQFSKRMILNK